MRTVDLTSLGRNVAQWFSKLADKKEPIRIAQNGVSVGYLIDFESYHELQSRISLLEGLLMGEQAIRSGNTVSNQDAIRRLSKWLE